MRGILVQIQPWDPAAGARVTLYMGSAANSLTLGLNATDWESVITRRPAISMELMDDEMSGRLMSGRASMGINVERIVGHAKPTSLEWQGAPTTIWSGDGPTFADMKTEFVGRVASGTPERETGALTLAFEVDRSRVDVPLLNLEYTGGGLANGDTELRGQLKPAGFGTCRNIPAIMINVVNNVFQVDGYGNTTSIDFVFEDAADMGASIGNFASYALLVAAAIPNGRFATCIAEGLFRLGAPPAGKITCDATFGSGTPGGMCTRWLQNHAGISAGLIRATDFTALTAAVTAVVGAAPSMGHWTQESESVLELVQELCASCNAMPLLMLDGTIGVSRIFGGVQQFELWRKNGDPLVTAWQTMEPPVPWWRMKMAAARVFYVNSETEIDFEDDIIDQGDYSALEVYRIGNVVRQPADGIRYLYINNTPTAGNAPPNVTYWSVYEDRATGRTFPPGPTPPVNPKDGDQWPDTSTTPPTLKRYSAGTLTWGTIANTVTTGPEIGVAAGAGTTLALGNVSGPAGAIIVGNMIDVSAPSAAFDQLVASQNSFPRAAYIEATVQANLRVNFGLSLDRTTYLVGTHWIGGVWVVTANTIAPYDTSGTIIGAAVALDPAAVYAIDCDGVISTFLKNGIAVATCPVVAGQTFFFKALFGQNLGGKLTGIRFEKGNSRAWSDEGGAGLPANNATADLKLNLNGAGLTIVGNSVSCTALIAAFAGAAYSSEAFVEGFTFEAVYGGLGGGVFQDDLIGVGTPGGSLVAGSGWLYAFNASPAGGGLWYYYEGGATASLGTAAVAGDRLRIVGDGVNVRYYINNNLVRTIGRTDSGQAFRAQAMLYKAGAAYSAISLAPSNRAAFLSIGGPGTPAPNAGTTVNIVVITAGSPVIQGNKIRQSLGAASYFYGAARGDPLYGPCFCEADITATWTLVGLDDDTTSYDYTGQVAIAFYNRSTGSCQMYFGAAGQFAVTIATGLNGKIAIAFDGYYVRVFVAGVQRGTPIAAPAALTSGAAIYPKWWAYDVNVDYTGLNAGFFTDRNVDNLIDGGTYTRLPVVNSVGSGTARRALVDFNQAHTNKTLDYVGDGSTYVRPLATEFTAGVPKLSVAGSGKKLGDIRNMPNVTGFGLSYKFTGTITYSAAAGTPATATISVTAGSTVGGSVSVSYNAMAVGVSGTNGTLITYFLYVDDPTNAGGTQTLVATTTPLTVFQADGRIYIGTCDVLYPASGSGGGGGGSGGGGCVDEGMFVLDSIVEHARDVRPGMQIRGLNYETMESDRAIPVRSICFSWEESVEIESATGILAIASTTTPCTLREGEPIPITECQGHRLPVRDDSGFRWEEIVRVERVGVRRVAHIRADGGTYAAGAEKGRYIYLHNPNPKP